jgi:hypothetical protein
LQLTFSLVYGRTANKAAVAHVFFVGWPVAISELIILVCLLSCIIREIAGRYATDDIGHVTERHQP